MAKPLMRLMYHSQVRTFIKKNRGIALSEATMQICFSYLAYKYISPATKALILDELNTRVKADEDSARVVGQAFVQQQSCLVAVLLDLPDAEVRRRTCKILGALRLKVFLDNWEPYVPILVVLLGEEDDDVRTGAMQILSRISSSLDGARAVGSTDFVKYAPALLDFATTRPLTCETLDNLALLLDEALEFFLSDGTSELRRLVYHSQARTFIEKKRGIELSDTTVNIYCYYLALEDISPAIKALILKELNARIEADEDSARVVEQVLVRESCCVAKLLDSSDARIWCYTCKILVALDLYWDNWEPPSLARIVELLGDEDDDIRIGAIQILCRVSRSLDGARAVGSTDFSKYVPSLLDFPTTRPLTWETLDNLAMLLDSEALESFLRDGTISVHASELRRLVYHSQAHTLVNKRGIALSDVTVRAYFSYLALEDTSHATRVLLLKELDARIKTDEDSARVVRQVFVQHRYYLARLLDSFDARILCYTWKILAALDFYWDDWEPPSLARIVELLGDADDDIRTGAIQILCRVSRSLDGARAVGSTDFLKYVLSLLDFATTRLLTCEMLNNLAFHCALLLDEALKTQLLLMRDDTVVREQLMFALF